jgi:hypothetical protein
MRFRSRRRQCFGRAGKTAISALQGRQCFINAYLKTTLARRLLWLARQWRLLRPMRPLVPKRVAQPESTERVLAPRRFTHQLGCRRLFRADFWYGWRHCKTHVHLCNLHGELNAATVYALGNAAVCGVAFEGSKASGGVAAPVKHRVTQN